MSARDCDRSVLVVDDDDAIREAVVEVLKEDGYRVVEARNGIEALEVLDGGAHPCVVLLDLMMPQMSGWEVVDKLRERGELASLPVVVTSAAAERSPAGVVRVLKKPLSLESLIEAVGEFCAVAAVDTSGREAALRELARRNIELAELQRFRDEMSALIVHDMKTPLAIVLSNIQFVLDGRLSEDEETKREALTDVRTAAERLSRLVQNLLDLVKLESGQFAPKRSMETIAAMLGPIVERRRRTAREHDVTIHVGQSPSASVSVDAELVARALENILDNALRFTPRGGRIEIEASKSDAHVHLRIGNTGAAIPASRRAHIFEKFGRGDGDDVGRMNLGLGLYFCRLVIESHGGTIAVEERADLPTVFAITLPL